MGLPIWRDYDKDEAKDVKENKTVDRTAPARSAIRRRPSIHGRGATNSSLSLQREAVRARFASRDSELNGRGQSVSETPGTASAAAPPPVPDSRNYFVSQDRRRRRRVELGQVSTSVSRAQESRRRGLLAASGDISPGGDVADARVREESATLVQDQEVATRNNLPTPPLEHSGDLQGIIIGNTSDTPRDTAIQDRAELWTPGSAAGGLGDRVRSPSPMSQVDDAWEVRRTSVPHDEALLAVEEGFASAAATAPLPDAVEGAAEDLRGNASNHPGGADEDGSEPYSPTSTDMYEFHLQYDTVSDTDSDASESRPPSDTASLDGLDEPERAMVASNLFRRRLRVLRRDVRAASRTVQLIRTRGDGSAPPRRPSQYSEAIQARGEDASRFTHAYFDAGDPTLAPGIMSGTNGSRVVEIPPMLEEPEQTEHDYRSERRLRYVIAETRGMMQSSADLLEQMCATLSREEHDLGHMRSIMQRLVNREEVPEDWWATAGLTSEHTRDVYVVNRSDRRRAVTDGPERVSDQGLERGRL